ncbi:MAG: hypothetical protein IAF38_05220 [Bacteroidia bacterium]|nr:hypothetical protein [Bacteroidia bacterium]
MKKLKTQRLFASAGIVAFRSFLQILCLAIVLFNSSCNGEKKDERTEKPVARVYETFLYPSDLKNIVPHDISAKDSALLIKNFIEKWVQDMLVLKHAEQNLTTEQLNVDNQMAEYRKNLIIYNYQSELVKQKLDTVVNQKDLEEYYNNNQESFTLKDNIVKVWYVKVNKSAPNIEKVKKWYRSEQPKDFISLKSYCIQFADNYFLDENNWLLFDELLKEVPVTSLNPELFLKTNRFIEVADSSFQYFVNVRGFRIKNSVSPLAFERENIRNIIINKRKLKLIEEMKREVYNNAKEKGKFEEY